MSCSILGTHEGLQVLGFITELIIFVRHNEDIDERFPK